MPAADAQSAQMMVLLASPLPDTVVAPAGKTIDSSVVFTVTVAPRTEDLSPLAKTLEGLQATQRTLRRVRARQLSMRAHTHTREKTKIKK